MIGALRTVPRFRSQISSVCIRSITTTVVEEAALKPSSPVGTIGSALDAQVLKNHFKRAMRVNEQPYGNWTYGELKKHVDALALGMIEARFRAGDKLALALPNNAEKIASMLACAKLGVVVVPLDVNPSREALQEVFELGVKGLIFTDQVGNTDYGELIKSIVPELAFFARVGTEGIPFRSEKYPNLRMLVNTGRTRVHGMTRFAWIATYDFGASLRRYSSEHVNPDSTFLYDYVSRQSFSHGHILELATKSFGNDVPSNSIAVVSSSLNTPAKFAAGAVGSYLHGAMSVYTTNLKAETLEHLLVNDKPQYFVGDKESLLLVPSIQGEFPAVKTTIVVGECDQQTINNAKTVLKSTQVLKL